LLFIHKLKLTYKKQLLITLGEPSLSLLILSHFLQFI